MLFTWHCTVQYIIHRKHIQGSPEIQNKMCGLQKKCLALSAKCISFKMFSFVVNNQYDETISVMILFHL